MRFREADAVLCGRILKGPIAGLHDQAERIANIIESLGGIETSLFSPIASRWRTNHLRAVAKVAQSLVHLAETAQDILNDEYKFEHSLDFLATMHKNLKDLTRFLIHLVVFVYSLNDISHYL